MILRILGEPRLEFGRIAERGGLLGKLHLGAHGGHGGAVLLVRGQPAEHGTRRLDVAAFEQEVSQPGRGVGAVGRLLEQAE